MLQRAFQILKQERLAQSSAVIVSLILITVVHAPAFPVVMGCILALAMSVVRGLSRHSKGVPVLREP